MQLARVFQGPMEDWPISFGTFGWGLAAVAGVLGALLLLWLGLQLGSLSYALDRNGIYVTQPGSRYTIPLDQITTILTTQPRSTAKPTIIFGRGRPEQQLWVETYGYAYRLALSDRERFSREVQERRQLGVVQSQPEGRVRARQALYDFFGGTVVRRLLLLSLILNLGLWSLLTWRFPELPTTVPVRFDPLGGTAGTRAKTYTLLLPTVASATWLGNLLLALLSYSRSRLIAELLLLGSLIVQLVLLLAIWFIVTVAR
jgi:hypothetical protein